jgi:hypothetical protein
MTLSTDEWRLVCALRALEPGPPQPGGVTLLQRLLELLEHPHCPEMQGDGVPCQSVDGQCDQCARAVTLEDLLDEEQHH